MSDPPPFSFTFFCVFMLCSLLLRSKAGVSNRHFADRMRPSKMIYAAPNNFHLSKYPKIISFLSNLTKMWHADTKYGLCAAREARFLYNVARVVVLEEFETPVPKLLTNRYAAAVLKTV